MATLPPNINELKKLETLNDIAELRSFTNEVSREVDAALGQIYCLTKLAEESRADPDTKAIATLADKLITKLKLQVSAIVTGFIKVNTGDDKVKPKDKKMADSLTSDPQLSSEWNERTKGKAAREKIASEIISRNDAGDLTLYLNNDVYSYDQLKQVEALIEKLNPANRTALNNAVNVRLAQISHTALNTYAQIMRGSDMSLAANASPYEGNADPNLVINDPNSPTN